MLAAHMDEIGIIATHIDRALVSYRFTTIGGVSPAYLRWRAGAFLRWNPGRHQL